MNRLFFNSLLFSFLMLSVACITGCSSDSPEDPDNPKPEIPQGTRTAPGLSFTSITLSNEGDTFACQIFGFNEGEWSAVSGQSWCNVTTQNNILKITALPNNESGTRTTTVSILYSNQTEMGKIEVIQRSLPDSEALNTVAISKQAFFPIFTATWCPHSPEMEKTLIRVQKAYQNTILPIRIFITGSEFYSPLSKELAQLYDNNYTPTGYFENSFKVENKSDPNVSFENFWYQVQGLSHTTDQQGTYSYIACSAKMTDDNIEAEVTVKAVKSGFHRLLVFILEDNIIKPQMSEAEGEILDYCHNGVLVGAMTPMKGQELDLSIFTKVLSLKSAIPSNTNKSNLRLLVVLERDEEELNFSDNCWYADNCISVPLGTAAGNSVGENIYVGDEIDN